MLSFRAESILALAIMLLLYLLIFLKIRSTKGGLGKSNYKREMSFFLQSFLVCSVFQLEIIAFANVSKLVTYGQTRYFLNFATNGMSILSNAVHSIVIISFNSTVRREIRRVLGMETGPEYGNGAITCVGKMERTIRAVSERTIIASARI